MTRHGRGRCGAATGPLPVWMLLAIAGLAWTARAEEPPAGDPALRTILEEHRADVGRLETRYLAARRERERATLARLKALQDEHCRQARLDEALAVREEIRRIERQSAEGVAEPPPTESRAPKGVPLTPLVPALPVAPRARRLERAPERAREPAPERTRVPAREQRPAEDARTPPPDAPPARRPFD